MQAHINQALHNEQFLAECCDKFPDTYFDWKVTTAFYIALHLLRAFCEKRDVDPGSTHYDIEKSFNPKKNNNHPITQSPKFVWECYSALQKYSEQARYDTFTDYEVENEIQRDNFAECQKLLESLKKYFHSQGVPCIVDEAA